MAAWLDALDRRHLADLTVAETARALRALSSCYVERRSQLVAGKALETRGKRAAFALFYGPLHFFATRQIIRSLGDPGLARAEQIIDLGCGTGVAGAAWALETNARRVAGFDRNPWAIVEANWTYRCLNLRGRAVQADTARAPVAARRGEGLLLAYVVNELTEPARARLHPQLLQAGARGARVLVIEPIARRMAPWWRDWEASFVEAGARTDEWRFPADLSQRQRELARAAGLDPRELTARSLCL